MRIQILRTLSLSLPLMTLVNIAEAAATASFDLSGAEQVRHAQKHDRVISTGGLIVICKASPPPHLKK